MVKDLIDAKGLPTSFGSVLFADNIARDDEAIVAMLRHYHSDKHFIYSLDIMHLDEMRRRRSAAKGGK